MSLDFIFAIILGFLPELVRDVVRWLFPPWHQVNERRIEGEQ